MNVYELILQDAGPNKIGVIKLVREMKGLSLAEAKELVESAPVLIVSGVSDDKAEHRRRQLKRLGAAVEIKEVDACPAWPAPHEGTS